MAKIIPDVDHLEVRRLPQVTIFSLAILGLGTLAACGSAADSATTEPNQGSTGNGYTIVAQPDDKGAAVIAAINSATTSIDIPIYSIGGDPAFDKAITDAMARGVNVRVMTNGGNGAYLPGDTSYAKMLAAAPGPGKGQMNWSSNNFDITHQKSIIVDAADSNGSPIAAGSLPSTAKVVISTGNFAGYQPPKGAPFQPFYHSRDYDITTSDTGLVTTIESAFNSDFTCASRTTINPSGLTPATVLGWSNGTTGANPADAAGQYPSQAEAYPWPGETGPNAQSQGNTRAIQEGLIKGTNSGDILRVTNEEMSDSAVVQDLIAAAGRGVDVRIIMTAPAPTAYGKPNPQYTNLQNIANAGATIHLFTKNDSDPTQLYIHSKTIAVNAAQAYAGSQNFSSTSLDFNRELGIQFGANDPSTITFLNATFDSDWAQNNPKQVTVWTKGSTPTPPNPSGVQSPTQLAESNMGSLQLLGSSPTPGQVCGPILTSTKSPSASASSSPSASSEK